MKGVTLTYLLGQLLGTAVLSSSQEITIFPSRGPIITVPSMSLELMPGLPLLCGLEPVTLIPGVNYTTRWILPGGETINSTRGRFVFSESLVSINGRNVPGTVLVVTQVSYQDAGMYTCEGRSTASRSGASAQWAAASFELQLNLGLLSNTSTIMATMNDSTIVLYCEMRAFIRQDSSLIWEGPSRQRIRGGMGKYLITFSNGLPNTSANGGGVLVPSRVSTLTIINPELSDAGTYTCSVMGTNQAVMIDLQVNSSDKRETTDTVTDINTTGGTQASSTTSLSGDNGTLQLAGIVVGSMAAILTGLLVITAAAVCCLVYKRKLYNKTEKIPNTDPDPGSNIYDYITLPRLDHGVQHRNDQPEETTATKWDDSITYDVIKDDNTVEKNRVYDEINYDLNTRKSDDACNINTIEVNGVAIDSEVNGDYEVPIDIFEKNKVYGVSTDGIDTTEGTMAYGAR